MKFPSKKSLPALAKFMVGLKNKDFILSQLEYIMSVGNPKFTSTDEMVKRILNSKDDYDEAEYDKYAKKYYQIINQLRDELAIYEVNYKDK